MADDKSKRGPQDRSKVNLSEQYEVDYWTKKWGISEDQLKAAVKKAGGSSVEAVAKALGKSA